MKLSDREIQNTIDLLKKGNIESDPKKTRRSAAEVEEINDVVKQIGDSPDIRQEKVKKLKKALESSSYDITGDEVAKKLIGRIFSDKIR